MDKWETIKEDKWETIGELPFGGNKDLKGPAIEAGKNALGGIDAALTMAAQTVPYIGSGLIGAATLPFAGAEGAEDIRQNLLNSGLGLGEVKPLTKRGEQATEMIGKGIDALKSKAGDLGGDSPAARTILEAGTELATNLLPIPGGKGVRKLGNAIEKRYSKKPVKKRAEDLFSAKQGVDVEPAKTRGPIETISQHELFDQPEMGRTVSPNEAVLGDWRIDENGIPIKADLSMEAQNLQAPLQKNLWGDELAPKHPQEAKPITQAIDETRAQADAVGRDRRYNVTKQLNAQLEAMGLNKSLDAPGELQSAVMEANSPFPSPPSASRRSQAGHINPEMLTDTFRAVKKVGDYTLKLVGKGRYGPSVDIYDKKGNRVGFLDTSAVWKGPEQNLEADMVKIHPEHQRKGLAEAAYRMLAEEGSDIHKSDMLLDDGKNMWNAFEKKGFANNGVINRVPLSQRGAIGRDLRSKTGVNAEIIPPDQRPPKEDTVRRPTSPEKIAEKQKARQVAKQFPVKVKGLEEFEPINTKEEAIELSQNVKDITPDMGQKMLVSGINTEAILTNSPILKFARTLFKDVRAYTDQFSSRYITDPKKGLTPMWAKMKTDEKIQVIDDLMSGDKHQKKITDDMMDDLGYSDAQRQFVKTFYDADQKMFEDWNAAMEKLGLKQIKEREGHFPGIFSGSYKTLVMNGKSVVAVIASDTKAQQKLAQKYMKEQLGDEVTFVEQERQGISSKLNRHYSDIFSGMSDVIDMLAKNDPRFAEVQEIASKAMVQANQRLFNFNVHALNKKGVVGNEGNRPWLSPERNANDAFKALVRYFEEGTQAHALQPALQELRDVAADPSVSHLRNTLKYLDEYTKKVKGQGISPLGAAIDTILDQPFKLMPTVAWGKGGVSAGFGVGSGVPVKLAGAVKNNMSQLFMGYGNYLFTATQLLQPGQTGLPLMQLAATRLGIPPVVAQAKIAKSMGKGGIDFLVAAAEDLSGHRVDALSPHMRDAYWYAKERGMLTFSEMEKAYQGTQGTLSRAKDRVAEVNMKAGESMTRTPMFMAFTDLLVNAGIDPKTAMPIAENLTQFSMIDYHAWERPMVYSKLGTLGQFAGGLATFKHGYAGQQLYLGKQALLPTKKTDGSRYSRQVLPIMASTAAMLALSGITGTMFYGEADQMFQYLTEKFGGKRETIRDAVLQGTPEWLDSGMISNATGINMQGKFSSADMVPDNIARAASPHLEGAWKILSSVIDFAKSGGDDIAVRNMLMAISPSSMKGLTEDAVARDSQNQVIGKDGLPVIKRTPEEWETRKWTGARPHREALERDQTYQQKQQMRADEERRSEISKEYKRAIIAGNIDEKKAKLEDEFQKRKGDIRTLLRLYVEVAKEKGKTEKERLEGVPSTPAGVNRWEYFNK